MGMNYIDAEMLKKAFLAGAKGLEANKEWINELNVFPVPDGDTGTNMSLTIMAAAKEVAALENPNMKDQGNECISDRDIHMIDALQNGIGHCRHGQEYHCRGTGNQHPDSLCVVAALEKQIINRSGKDGQPYGRRDGNQHGKTDGKACLGDNRPLFLSGNRPGK